jgi:phosphoglycolate phosphatase
VASLLVLWDVDHTLADTDGVGQRLYQLAFAEMFGGELPRTGSMAGRTDRAIVLEVLTLAGVPEPHRQVHAFEAVLAAHAPELADLVRRRARALPGAAAALAALADGFAPFHAATAHEEAASRHTTATRDTTATAQNAAMAHNAVPTRNAAPPGGHRDRLLVQSLLTGNIRALAEVKLGPLGLTEHLDLEVGAYGDTSEVRAELVPLARGLAALAYDRDFGGEATVLVGDTPRDVEAALATGARAVGVATGSFTAADLGAAGAHAVLNDLTDTRQVLAAILAEPVP